VKSGSICSPRSRRCTVAYIAALAFALIAILAAFAVQAEVRVTDDRGTMLVLKSPARRIVSLAPHLTELLYAAGAGERVVGTVDFSDFPPGAKAIPRIGSSSMLDIERVIALHPDVIVVWWHGNAEAQLDKLRALGIPMFYSESRRLSDIARALLQLGTLAGTGASARSAADNYSERLASLRARYAERRPVPLFWQVWARPLLTVNGAHIVSDVIALCGGSNVFARLPALVPAVSTEAVVEANPEAIVTTSTDATADGSDGLDTWRKLPSLRATARGNLIVLDAETIHRQSQRILDGAAALCGELERVRARGDR
jgi:iron complex transport system substrate-binding protein